MNPNDCAWHPGRAAEVTCPRCGSFVCRECLPRGSALAVCAHCLQYAPPRSGLERLPGIFLAILGGLQMLWMGGAAAMIAVELTTGKRLVESSREAPNAGALVLLLVMTALNVALIVSGIQFARLQGRTWGLVASIAAMLPCLGPCCVLGIPVGIWGVLTAQKMPAELWARE